MALTDQILKQRTRRAYEAGRLASTPRVTWPAAVMTALSYVLCHEPGLTLTFGGLLIGYATWMLWAGRWQQRAARAGLEAGVLAFSIPFVGFYLDLHELIGLAAASLLLNAGGGFIGGLIIGWRSRWIAEKNRFLMAGAAITTLSGLLGCLFFGYFGIVAMLLGMLIATAPVGLYRLLTT